MKHSRNSISITDFFIGLMVISSISLRNYRFLLYGIQLLTFLLCGKKLLHHINYHYFLGSFAFLSILIFSLLWSVDQSVVFGSLISTAQIYLLCILLSGYLKNRENLEKFIMFFVIAMPVLAINALISTSPAQWRYMIDFGKSTFVNRASSGGRLGSTVGLHPNMLGGSCAICLCCVLYAFHRTKHKRYLFIAALTLIMIVLSKSRSSMLESFLGAFLFYIFLPRKQGSKMARIAVAGIAGILLLWASLNIPALYTLIGYRIEGVLSGLLGESADASTSTRMNFIKIAWQIFLDRPLLGVGLNNFSVVAYKDYNIWAQTYAHNTFAEILADLGFIGFISYFGIRAYSMLKIRKTYNINKHSTDKDSHRLGAFLMSVTLMLMISNMSHVIYNAEVYQYMYLLCIVFANRPAKFMQPYTLD